MIQPTLIMPSNFAMNNTLAFANLSYTVKTKQGSTKKLTNDVSLQVQAGEMVGTYHRSFSLLPLSFRAREAAYPLFIGSHNGALWLG